jgi:hypothetical protein
LNCNRAATVKSCERFEAESCFSPSTPSTAKNAKKTKNESGTRLLAWGAFLAFLAVLGVLGENLFSPLVREAAAEAKAASGNWI